MAEVIVSGQTIERIMGVTRLLGWPDFGGAEFNEKLTNFFTENSAGFLNISSPVFMKDSHGRVFFSQSDDAMFRVRGVPSLCLVHNLRVVRVPLGIFIGSGIGEQSAGNTVYCHWVVTGGEIKPYVGITNQPIASRFAQHMSAARNGSRYLFHEALRRAGDQLIIHDVLAAGESREHALAMEEQFVFEISLFPRGLNAIPGGMAGFRYLAKMLGVSEIRFKQWEHRSALLKRLPGLHQKVLNDASIQAMITNNPRNFSRFDLMKLAYLMRDGSNIERMAMAMNCSKARISRLLNGKTYSRVFVPLQAGI